MSQLKNNQIEVFPSVRRQPVQTSSRLLSEKSLVNLVNRLTDSKRYVMTTSNIDENTELEFNIDGYYFKVKISDILGLFTERPENIYASISISDDMNYPELTCDNIGSDELYTGINFSNTAVAGSLHILKYQDPIWVIPVESQVKMQQKSVRITAIDGGLI